MGGPVVDIPLPLYRSTMTVNAAQIVGVGENGQVQVDFPRYGDDLPILKSVSGPAPQVGDYFIEPGTAMSVSEFARNYRAISSDPPKEPLPIKASYARIAYEAARANQGGKGPIWEQTGEIEKAANIALATYLLDNPHATNSDAHEVWRACSAGSADLAAQTQWAKLSPERQGGLKVFRAVITALK